MTMIHQAPETPLARRIQRNSSGSGGLSAGGVGMPTLFSPRKRMSGTSTSADEYSGTTLTNDESEASDINDFDAFGLSSPVKKPSSNDPFSPFEFSTANFDTGANFFATKMDNQQQQQVFGNNDGFGAFPVLSQVTKATSIPAPLDEDASLNDDEDDDCFSPKRIPRKHSSSISSSRHLLDSRVHSTHGTPFTTTQSGKTSSDRNPPSHSNSASSSTNNNRGGGGRRTSRSHHDRPDYGDELEHGNQPSGNEEQRSSEGDSKSKSQSRKGSSRKISTSSHKPTDEQPSSTTKRSSTKSSQRSHSVGRKANTSAKHRKSSDDVTTSPSSKGSSNEAEKEQQISRRDGRPNLARSSSFSDRKANRKSILKSDHDPNEETPDSNKNRLHRGQASGQESSSTKRRSHSESRRAALSTKMSGGNQRRPSTNNPSETTTTTNNNNPGRSFRRPAASILEMSTPKKDGTDILLSSPVSKGGSSRQERTTPSTRSVARFHSDLGKGAHHEGRRPSRRLLAIEATRMVVDDGDEMLSPGSKDNGSHSGRRSERFTAPQRSSSLVAAGLAFPPEDKQSRGSARACRRTILKEDVFASPRATDSKGGVSNRRLGGSIHSSILANSTHASPVAMGVGGLFGSPVLSKKSPGTGNGSGKRPVFERTPPAQTQSDSSTIRRRDFDPRLDNLLQKLRDPSHRDLNPEKDARDVDDDVTAQGIPVNQRGVFTRIAPMSHKSFTDA